MSIATWFDWPRNTSICELTLPRSLIAEPASSVNRPMCVTTKPVWCRFHGKRIDAAQKMFDRQQGQQGGEKPGVIDQKRDRRRPEVRLDKRGQPSRHGQRPESARRPASATPETRKSEHRPDVNRLARITELQTGHSRVSTELRRASRAGAAPELNIRSNNPSAVQQRRDTYYSAAGRGKYTRPIGHHPVVARCRSRNSVALY